MQDRQKRRERDWRLLRIGFGLGLGALALGLVLPLALHDFINWYLSGLVHRRIPVPSVQDFGNAGEYFSLVIGVPLAIVATLIAGAASVFFAQYTFSKDDVAIFSFVEELMRPVSQSIKNMVREFVALLKVGNDSIRLTWEIREAIKEKKPDGDNPNVKIADLLTPEQRANFLPRIEKSIAAIKTSLEAWAREYEILLSTMFGTLFAREEVHNALASKPWGTANSYLRSILPIGLQDDLGLMTNTEESIAALSSRDTASQASRKSVNPRDPAEYPNDIRQVLSYITGYDDVKPEVALESFIGAARLLPTDFTTIEFIGAAINSPIFWLQKPHRRMFKGLTIHGYLFNLGAAQLLTLYQYIPDRPAIQSAIIKIFEHRSKAAENFVALAAPTARDFTRFSTDDSIRWQFLRPERMIVVLAERGSGNFTSESYDRSEHGEIPATGYEHQRLSQERPGAY